MKKRSNYPFLSPDEEILYTEQKIIRKITDSQSGTDVNWKIDAIVTKLRDVGKVMIDYKKLERESKRNIHQFRKSLSKAEEATLKNKNQSTQQSRINIFCISTLDEDGMSWSSQMVYDAVERSQKEQKGINFNIIPIQCETQSQGPPYISSVIGHNKFLKLINKSGIKEKKWLSLNTKYYIRSILTLIFAVLGNFIFEVLKSEGDLAIGALRIPIILTAIVIGFLINLLLERVLIIDPTENNSAKNNSSEFNNYLRNGPFNDDEKLTNLIKLVAEKLFVLSSPRFVIIDNYENLDAFSRRVIDYYFLNHHLNSRPSEKEYWVIFEPYHGDVFGRKKYDEEFKAADAISIHLFEQVLLSKDEKRRLIETNRLGNLDKRINSTTVKSVCWDIEGYRWINENIKASNNSFQSKFLTLLSLTASPRNVEFSLYNIEEIFWIGKREKDKVKNSILQFYFFENENKTWPTDYGKLMNELVSSPFFRKMIQITNKGRNKYWQVISEVSEIIGEIEELGDSRFRGHIFWSLHWYNKIIKSSLQAVDFKKLSYHLCELDLAGIHSYSDQGGKLVSIDDILKDLFEAYLFTVDGCLRTCLITYKANENYEESTGMLRLLKKTFDTVLHFKQIERKSDLERLLCKCWEFYFITLEEGLLKLIGKINDELGNEGTTGISEKPLLEKVFYESLPLPPDVKRKSIGLPWESFSNSIVKFQPVYELMQVRTTWLTLTMEPSLYLNPESVYRTARAEGIEILIKNLDSTSERIQNSLSVKDCVIDFMHLSYSIWTYAIFFDFFQPSTDKEFDNKYLQKIKAISHVLGNPKILRQLPGTGEYFINSLLIEIAIFSMCGIVVYLYTHRKTLKAIKSSKVLNDDLNEIIKLLDTFLETKIGPVKNVEDLFNDKQIEKIDTYLEFSCLIWKRLQLDEMYNLVAVRRVHFNTICSANKKNKRFYLSNIIGTTVNENAHSRLLVHLSKIIYKRDSIELRAKFLADTARYVRSNENNFGILIKEELALISFLGPSSLSGNPDEFAGILIKGDKLQETKLFRFLSVTHADEMSGVVNRIYNIFDRLKNSLMQQKIEDIVDEYISALENDQLKKELYDQIKFHKFTDSILEIKQVDTVSILNDWKTQKNKWYYPEILRLCLLFDTYSKELEAECIRVLSHEHFEDDFNSCFRLSTLFLKNNLDRNVSGDHENIKIAEKYLHESIERFYYINAASINMQAYEMLERLNNENRELYNQKKLYWKEQWDEIQSLQFFIDFLNQHKFCTLFLSLVDHMIIYGLEIGNSNKEELSSIPVALYEENGQISVNEKFIMICRNIVEDNSTTPEQEIDANEVAGNNLAKLIDICFDLKSLPKQMKALLNEFRDQVDEFIIRDEPDEG